MIVIFLAFTAFILAFFQFAKRITFFRLALGFLTNKHLLTIIIITGLVALADSVIDRNPLIENWTITVYKQPYDINHLWINNNHTRSISTSTFEHFHSPISSQNTQTNFSYNIPLKFIWHTILFIAYAAWVILVTYFFHAVLFPGKFCKKNAKKYFQQCSLIIGSGVKEDIRSLTNEVSNSVSTIFELATQENNPASEFAYELIELFTDSFFCKATVNHNPLLLYKIFGQVIKNCVQYNGLGKKLIDRLILFMFTESDSLLLREEPYHGGRFKTFKYLIFGDVSFLTSSYRPLSNWLHGKEEYLNPNAIKKYFEVIKFSLEEYLKQRDNCPDVFYSALNNVAEIIKNNIWLSNQQKNKSSSTCKNNLVACSIEIDFFISFILKKHQSFSAAPTINDKDYSYFENDRNIYGALAYGIYEIINSFSQDADSHESIRILMLEIYEFPDKNCVPLNAIKERLDVLLKDKITENLTALFYPPVTASLIYAFGLCEPNKANLPIHKFLLSTLKEKFISAYKTNPEIASDMLPDDTEYNAVSKKLIRKAPIQWIRNKTVQELTLDDDNPQEQNKSP